MPSCESEENFPRSQANSLCSSRSDCSSTTSSVDTSTIPPISSSNLSDHPADTTGINCDVSRTNTTMSSLSIPNNSCQIRDTNVRASAYSTNVTTTPGVTNGSVSDDFHSSTPTSYSTPYPSNTISSHLRLPSVPSNQPNSALSVNTVGMTPGPGRPSELNSRHSTVQPPPAGIGVNQTLGFDPLLLKTRSCVYE